MGYANQYGSSQNADGYGDDQGYGSGAKEPSELDDLQSKYGQNAPTRNDSTGLSATDNQSMAKAAAQGQLQANFNKQSNDDASDRTYRDGRNSLDLRRRSDDLAFTAESNSRKLVEGIDKDKVDVDNKYKASQSKLDRDKSIDEFTQNRYQTRANQAQDRANLEYSTAQGLAKDKQGQDAELIRLRASGDVASALATKTNDANLNLAKISQATELAGQTSAVDRAMLAANAQVKAALYAPRSYQGY